MEDVAMYVCIYVCMYMYVCMHICICVCVYVCMYVYVYICVCVLKGLRLYLWIPFVGEEVIYEDEEYNKINFDKVKKLRPAFEKEGEQHEYFILSINRLLHLNEIKC